ncbi:hypothetical protein EGT67_14070 [Prescottella agglutinans]|uniref:Uncharacterized protein n=1 Tax=Prescottella agglutinans TaxID=1644129 RepID=A0A438BCC4_9NOCA|nr:hypothetical protein [Prescottella agglutinans]RVW08666.1 hypothetical protein EGT67_14070 [Prescottella agglutinans]
MAINQQFGFDRISLPDGAVCTRELQTAILDTLELGGDGHLSLATQTAILGSLKIIGDLEARVAALEAGK